MGRNFCIFPMVIMAIIGVLALSAAACASESVLAQLYAGRKADVRISRAESGKTMLLVDGKPQPLHWACLTEGEPPEYKRAGFNTVLVEFYYPGKDVSLEEAFKKWDERLLNVKQRNLYALIYIHNTVHMYAGDTPWAFDARWQDYVQTIVKRYKGITNLVGWLFADEPGDHITYTNPDFRRFLRDEYGSIESLNASWGSDYRSFYQVRLEYQRNGRGRPEDSMVSPQHPFSVGPKAFDSARFKVANTGWAHQKYEQVVREVDPVTPIWGGANNLAWPVPQIPSGWGAFFDFYPQFSGNDFVTHHIWVMDIGRGPNMRPVMQMLMPEHSANYNWHLDARVLRGWMVESAIHGASGVTFWPWGFLRADRPGDRSTSAERIDCIGETIRTLQDSGIFELLPQPTIGVVYQSYAEGWGNMSQVYGLLRYPSGEPLPIMEELKFGTEFGQVEYLTDAGLKTADLDKYGVILAPFAADVDQQTLDRLTRYVRGGGVLLADIGFACIQGGKVITGMPEGAKKLFGIKKLAVSFSGPGRWVATGEHPDLFGNLRPNVDYTTSLSKMALDVTPSTAVQVLRGPGGQGLYVNKVGKGYAVFCSALAWAQPSTTDPVVRQIHNALFARRARIQCVSHNESLGEPHFSQGYEVALYNRGSYAVQNRSGTQAVIKVKVEGRTAEHSLPPRSVILVKDGMVIPLGTGIWPVELGPK